MVSCTVDIFTGQIFTGGKEIYGHSRETYRERQRKRKRENLTHIEGERDRKSQRGAKER